MILRKLSTRYAIDLPIDRFMELLELVVNTEGVDPVEAALEAIEGVRVTAMNGHFGASVFIEIDDEHDTPRTRFLVAEALSDL